MRNPISKSNKTVSTRHCSYSSKCPRSTIHYAGITFDVTILCQVGPTSRICDRIILQMKRIITYFAKFTYEMASTDEYVHDKNSDYRRQSSVTYVIVPT